MVPKFVELRAQPLKMYLPGRYKRSDNCWLLILIFSFSCSLESVSDGVINALNSPPTGVFIFFLLNFIIGFELSRLATISESETISSSDP